MSAAKLMHAGLFENRMQSLLSVTRRFLEPTDFQLGLDKENKIYGACRPPAISLPAWHCMARVLATARVSAAGAPHRQSMPRLIRRA